MNISQETLKKKWFIVLVGGLVFISLIIVLLLTSVPKQEQLPENIAEVQYTEPLNLPTSIPTISIELKRAIEKQLRADQEYADIQRSIKSQFPWVNDLPIQGDNFFVYFDLEKKAFIGKLYPKSSDNAEQLKAALIKYMIEVKEIPANSYPFEWSVFPQ